MKKQKEHKIGEQFENCKLIYEVRENETCKGCAFFIEEENHCTRNKLNEIGLCSGYLRNDGKNVIFIQIGEAKD